MAHLGPLRVELAREAAQKTSDPARVGLLRPAAVMARSHVSRRRETSLTRSALTSSSRGPRVARGLEAEEAGVVPSGVISRAGGEGRRGLHPRHQAGGGVSASRGVVSSRRIIMRSPWARYQPGDICRSALEASLAGRVGRAGPHLPASGRQGRAAGRSHDGGRRHVPGRGPARSRAKGHGAPRVLPCREEAAGRSGGRNPLPAIRACASPNTRGVPSSERRAVHFWRDRSTAR